MADKHGGIEGLSGRERQILDLLARNLRSKEIGAFLGIHPRTVDNHCLTICKKLGAVDRFDAVRMWINATWDWQDLDPESMRRPSSDSSVPSSFEPERDSELGCEPDPRQEAEGNDDT